tara:strand:- start:610 stop:720 length:111 start_codon:yes stop_codon:yes gene_type:complete
LKQLKIIRCPFEIYNQYKIIPKIKIYKKFGEIKKIL